MRTYRTDHKTKEERQKRFEKIHPYKMILWLAMLGSFMLFFYTIVAYLASYIQFNTQSFSVPKAFILSSFFILFSSFTIKPSMECFQKENAQRLKKSLHITLILGIAFLICQVIGWRDMLGSGAELGGNRSATYLYILSGLHGFHFLGGIIFLAWITNQWSRWSADPVKILIATTNPFEKIKLELLNIYWHFLDAMWIILFLFFLFFVY